MVSSTSSKVPRTTLVDEGGLNLGPSFEVPADLGEDRARQDLAASVPGEEVNAAGVVLVVGVERGQERPGVEHSRCDHSAMLRRRSMRSRV